MAAVELPQKPSDAHADLEAGDERSRGQGQGRADQGPQRLRGGGMSLLDSRLEGLCPATSETEGKN